jgi:16S rRNA (uracil1498-N3)-methyltransferase
MFSSEHSDSLRELANFLPGVRMSDRFFTEQPLGVGEISLDGPEAHHLSTVRRFEAGEVVTLFNGDGAEYPAEILSVAKKSVVLQVTQRLERCRELAHPVWIASAVPKADRADFLIEKLTELGVTVWIPLLCERSVVMPKEAKREKFERAVIEASKQCGRNTLMQIEPPCRLSDLVQRVGLPEKRYFLHPTEQTGSIAASSGVIAAIGPEGGFSLQEVELFLAKGWQGLQLGSRILRIETAAIAVATLLALHQ